MESNTKILNNLIRKDTIAGTPKTIVGDRFSDLVLETLGKVYIKSGRQLNLLSDVINQISQTSENDLKNRTIIVSSLEELNNMEYPGEGYFIFNKTTGILYISLGNRYIALINASEFSESGYVKKSGDVMTGPLEFISDKENLIISNSKLIKNLNSNYLNGYTDSDFAKKHKDEKIYGDWDIEGKWDFNNKVVFNDNIRSHKDYITDGSLSSPEFASGFSGYGWRLDASTNTFTIDYLVVRKMMMVYEMVINKIMATNGSLWVSNSSKIEKIHQVNFIIPDRLQLINHTGEISKLVKDENDYIINDGIKPDQYYLSVYPQLVNGSNLSSSTKLGTDKTKLIPRELHYINSTEVQIRPINQGSEIAHVITYTQGEGYPINEDVISSSFEAEVENTNVEIFTYLKYFANSYNTIPNCYIIETDSEEYPMFREGDILRCQKYSLGAMKYYDAIVLLHIADRSYLIQIAESVFDKYTEFEYNENGNLIGYKEEYNETLYNKTNKTLNDKGEYVYTSKSYENEDGSYNGESSLGTVQEGDDLVQIGNVYNIDRQGALYLTATDDQGPYMDILDGVNRPDYSVLYKQISIKPLIFENEWYLSTRIDDNLGSAPAIQLYINADKTEYRPATGLLPFGWTRIICYQYPITGPVPDYVIGATETYYNKPTKVRLGKLDGIYNPIFKEKQPKGYGLYGENVYLTGEFILNNGKSVVEFTEDSIKLAVGNIDQLEKDLESVKEQLESFDEEFISNDDLDSAGMHIGKDGIILWADAIKIATEKDDMDNPNKYTALFSDGKLSAQVFEAVGYNKKYTNETYEIVTTVNNVYSCRQVLGYTGNDINSPSIGMCNNYIENNILYICSSNYLIFKKIDTNIGFDRFDGEFCISVTNFTYNPIPENINTIIYGDYTYSTESKTLYKPGEHLYNEEPYTTVSINKLGKGETIYYYPSGCIMNCKIFKNTEDTISGCIEYFFDDRVCYLSDVNKGYEYFKNTYVEGKNGCVKIIDYFVNPNTNVTLNTVKIYNIKHWNPSSTSYQEFTMVPRINQNSKDVVKIASRCNIDSSFNLYYVSSLGEGFSKENFEYKGKVYNVFNYYYNDIKCSDCISEILSSTSVNDTLFNRWLSFTNIDKYTADYLLYTINLDSIDTENRYFIYEYKYNDLNSTGSLKLLSINQGDDTDNIKDRINNTIPISYFNFGNLSNII